MGAGHIEWQGTLSSTLYFMCSLQQNAASWCYYMQDVRAVKNYCVTGAVLPGLTFLVIDQ